MTKYVSQLSAASLIVFSATCASSAAPVTISSLVGGAYSQNFNTLPTTLASAESFNSSITGDSPYLPGWLAYYGGTGTPELRVSNGGTSTPSFYSHGTTSSTDRALGSLPGDTIAGTTGVAALISGVRFVNDTDKEITSFDLSWTGEQWRAAYNTTGSPAVADPRNNTLTVGYAVFNAGAGSLHVSGTYTPLTTFNTPVDISSSTSGNSLDGNASANRVTGLTSTGIAVSVLPGREIWFRYFDGNSAGVDHGVAVDDLSINFTLIPEPTSALALIGLVGMGMIRRRRVG